MRDSGIQWTTHTFNPWVGCQRVSPGCENCYAETRDKRFHAGRHWGPGGTRQVTSAAIWRQPEQWNAEAAAAGVRARVFCASLADVFEDRPEIVEPRARLFAIIGRTPHLDWQLLTKRPENMTRLAPPEWANGWPSNVWAGTTVEDQRRADERIPHLLGVPARVRFLSCEPLVETVGLSAFFGGAYVALPGDRVEPNYNFGIHWVIVGGESGPGARPFDVAWARSIVKQCRDAGVAVFVKQMGTQPVLGRDSVDTSGQPLRMLSPLRFAAKKGSDPAEWPADLDIREFPKGATR